MCRLLRISVIITPLLCGYMLYAQEPASIEGAPAVRFEQSPGYFHYVSFCRTPKDFSAQMPRSGLPLDKIEFGIGWYVTAGVARTTGAATEVDGRIVISPHHVRFMPANAQFAQEYVDLPRAEVALIHSPGQPDGALRGKDITLNFQFRKICLSCVPGTPIPAGLNAAHLEQEFALFDANLTHFESGWRTTYRLSQGAPAEIASGNRPAHAASPASRPGPAPKVTTAPSPDAPSAGRSAPADSGISSPAAATVGRSTPPAPDTAKVANSPATPPASSRPTALGSPKARPVKIGSGTASGLLIKKVPPSYPLEAKLVRLEGAVILHVVIDRSGEVSEVNTLSGPPLLESAAVDAVKQWQYRPYAVNGEPVDVETTIEVVFALDGLNPVTRARK